MTCRPAGRRSRRSWDDPAPLDRASLDDFYAGRSDRLGVDLVLTTSPLTFTVPVAIDAGPDRDLGSLVDVLRRTRADLVWLLLDGGCPPEHLAALVRLIRRVGADVLAVEPDPEVAVPH